MFDLKWLRDHPDAFDASLARRGQPPAAASILALDTERRRIDARLQEELAERNELSRRIGALKVKGQNAEEPLRRVATLKDGIKAGEDELRAAQARLDAALATYPNLLAAEVPDGKDERNNVELRRWGTPRRADFPLRSHEEVGATLGMDFERAAKLSGSRFVVLWGQLARLERALAQFMLDLHTREHGYTEVSAPVMVRDAALFGTSQLPKFADDLFHLTSGHWLIPTAEVSLTNLMAAEIVDQTHLPLRMTAGTLCFRSEAGAAGKDTKGMLRQHQFQKIELVSITAPERSVEEHERMTGCAEAVLQRLGVPYRVVLLCAGDTGFGSTKTYDIEAWLPGQMTYREISSCSNCGDFQARRMAARYRPADGKGTRFVHTLNGSGVAVGRALIAVLENYQEADGAVTIPEALRPYMGGEQWLAPAHG